MKVKFETLTDDVKMCKATIKVLTDEGVEFVQDIKVPYSEYATLPTQKVIDYTISELIYHLLLNMKEHEKRKVKS